MKEENVTNIDDLVELMDAEAIKWGRTDSPQVTVNGKGIEEQFGNATFFPWAVHYLIAMQEGVNDETGAEIINFHMKKMWFTEEGDVTERPEE